MHGRVRRLLERGDRHNYNEWLRIQQAQGQLSHTQAEALWADFLAQSQEAKRHEANLAREALGKQPIPWSFGIPHHGCLSTTSTLAQAKPKAKRSKVIKVRPSSPPPGMNALDRTINWMAAPHKYIEASDLTWEAFLRGFALPNMHHGVDPLNQQRDI